MVGYRVVSRCLDIKDSLAEGEDLEDIFLSDPAGCLPRVTSVGYLSGRTVLLSVTVWRSELFCLEEGYRACRRTMRLERKRARASHCTAAAI